MFADESWENIKLWKRGKGIQLILSFQPYLLFGRRRAPCYINFNFKLVLPKIYRPLQMVDIGLQECFGLFSTKCNQKQKIQKPGVLTSLRIAWQTSSQGGGRFRCFAQGAWSNDQWFGTTGRSIDALAIL